MGLDGKTNSFRQPSGNGLFALKVVWHVHNLSSRISRNKSEHHLESTKHSICCRWIILCVALSSSIAVYCRLCCSLILPAIYWGRTKSSAISKVAKAKNTNVPICFSWLNCALQGIEAMFWVSMRLFEACVTDV